MGTIMNSKFLTAAIFAFSGFVGTANALDIQQGGQPKLKVTKMQMAIKSPATNACPAQAKLKTWVFTNKAGTVDVYIARQGGGVSGPFKVASKATGNGVFMGTYSRSLNIHQPIDAMYRASAPKQKGLSNWVPLKANCSFGLGGNGELQN